MIKGKITSDMKKLFNAIRKVNSQMKKAIKPVGKAVLAKMKGNCPVDTRALKQSLAKKEVAKGGKSCAVVVGVRSRFQKVVNGQRKIPNLYARVVNEATGFIDDALTPVEKQKMTNEIKKAVGELFR